MSIPLVPVKHEITTPPITTVDFIDRLPLEVSQLILDNLDTRSLLNAAQVSHSWLLACKSRHEYRSRVHDYITYLNDAWEEYREQRQRYRTERMKERGLQIGCVCLLGTFILFCAVITVSLVSKHFSGGRLLLDPYHRLSSNTQPFG